MFSAFQRGKSKKKYPPLGTVFVTVAEIVSSFAAPTTYEEGFKLKLAVGIRPGVQVKMISAVSDSPVDESKVKDSEGRTEIGLVIALVMLN